MAHKTKNGTGNHKTISGVSRTSRLCVIFIKLDGHIKLILLIKAVEAVVDINVRRYQSHSVNGFFFTELRPFTRDIIVSGIPWDTEVQEIIEHFEVNNFLFRKDQNES